MIMTNINDNQVKEIAPKKDIVMVNNDALAPVLDNINTVTDLDIWLVCVEIFNHQIEDMKGQLKDHQTVVPSSNAKQTVTISAKQINRALNKTIKTSRIVQAMTKIEDFILMASSTANIKIIPTGQKLHNEWEYEVTLYSDSVYLKGQIFTLNIANFLHFKKKNQKKTYLAMCKYSTRGTLLLNEESWITTLYGSKTPVRVSLAKWKQELSEMNKAWSEHFDKDLIKRAFIDHDGRLVMVFRKSLLKKTLFQRIIQKEPEGQFFIIDGKFIG